MDRRRFFRAGVVSGGLTLGLGGIVFHRRARAREALASDLLGDALPEFAGNCIGELRTLPPRAGEGIERHFHGACLNVEGFVAHVCSDAFAGRLGRCHSPEEREACFTEAFCARVATEAAVLHWVRTIAAGVGAELDDAWAAYCVGLSRKWDSRVREYGVPLGAGELAGRLEGLVRQGLDGAIRLASSGDRPPALGDTVAKVGESAVLLLPLARLGKAGLAVGVPVFFLLAARHVWEYAAARLERRAGDYQAAISGRMAMLGQRLAAEFGREVRRRVADLHAWREEAVRRTAQRLSEERVGFI